MNKDRFVITDRMWELMEPHCLGKPGARGGDYFLAATSPAATLLIVEAKQTDGLHFYGGL